MPVNLDSSISWSSAASDDLIMLQNLQPNIVKPHVRDFLTILFLKFEHPAGARAFVADLSAMMKSALAHLQEIANFKLTKIAGTPYIGFGLSKPGYKALGLPVSPSDPAFLNGMHANAGLNDPDIGDWEPHFQDPDSLHAVVLVGDMLKDRRDAALARVTAAITAAAGVVVLATQEGLGQHNTNGEGLEHFGYVDGRSQPLFLTEDIDAEESSTDGIANWKPGCPLSQVIVSDQGAPDPATHFGSYFVFRKLEQNVRLFKSNEKHLADRLALADDERAGAMLVGRFEDGTPVAMQFADGVESPVPNNFNYDSDKAGAKCPFSGHIRKTNPRGSGSFGQTESQERSHIMARRGQTYGVRSDDLNDGRVDNKPEKDVGLLFMAFNSDLQHQFEFTQISWANNPGFPQVPAGSSPPGIDPVIGQTPNDGPRGDIGCPVNWGAPASVTVVASVPRAVTMKGGQYFFMPSLAFLASLGAPAK